MLSRITLSRKKSSSLTYSEKLPTEKKGIEGDIISLSKQEKEKLTNSKSSGILYFGDNLEILRKHIDTKSVDLIYLDPPFNSNVNYNVIFKTKNQKDSPSQIRAFEDTWKWGNETEKVYHEILTMGDRIADVIKGLREAIGENDMMAYVTMMSIRLVELHRVLKKTGSLYLHCDPTASHYLKIILDSIFGPENFRNEIIWKRTIGATSIANKFRIQTDSIFFYSKSSSYVFHEQFTKAHFTKEGILEKFPLTDPVKGSYCTDNLANPDFRPNLMYDYKGYKHPEKGWAISLKKMKKWDSEGRLHFPENKSHRIRRKRFLSEWKGAPVQNIWDDISPLHSHSKERLGYPTQKPISLLERIIETSSNEGDVILDPFCGCGTAIHASQKLNRNWIGIDVTHLAIGIIECRLRRAFGIKPMVKGVPTSFESAQDLADRDKFQFEAWAVTRINGIMPNQKKGKDGGIDGRGYIPMGNNRKEKTQYAKVIVSVKGGQRIGPSMVRDLKGTVTRENADFGIFICIKEPTPDMITEAATGGIFETPIGTKHPKIQIYTIKNYFDGKYPDIPQISNVLESTYLAKTESKSKQSTLS